MTESRKFGVFAIAFAAAYPAIYLIAFELNLAAFTYHAAIGQFALGPSKPIAGPAMYWYGWITTSAGLAFVAAAIVAYLPDNMTRRLPATVAWAVPFAALVTACGLMIKMYFFR
jgi:hypothetical protein